MRFGLGVVGMRVAHEVSVICDQVEELAGELAHYAARYWELREVMDRVRAKVNAPEAMADGDVVGLVQLVLRTECREPPAMATVGPVNRG